MQDLCHPMKMDRFNRELIEKVHPEKWVNPTPSGEYDLVVVGAGSAGLVAALGGARLGARTALVEKEFLGGDCLNFGCVPSKLLIRSARLVREIRESERYGIRTSDLKVDFPAVMTRLRQVRTRISEHDSVEKVRKEGIDLFFGKGIFTSPRELSVGNTTLKFKRAIIASGAKTFIPPIEGIDTCGFVTNQSIFNIEELPETLMILGGGPLGCELALAFARFGSEVTIIQRGSQFLPREDPDAAAVVADVFREEGVHIMFNSQLRTIRVRDGYKEAHIETEGKGEQICKVKEFLLATGRTPDLEGIGLETAGVEYDRRKGVIVGDDLRSTNPRIYAAGDSCMKFKFTHTADASARIALQNALFPGSKKKSSMCIPWCTYVDPEIAHVGMYEKDAKDKGIDFDSIKVSLEEIDRAQLEGNTRGFLKITFEKKKGRILGATLVADHAGDMICQVGSSIKAGLTMGKLSEVIYPYPTQAEIFRRAGDIYNSRKLTPLVKKLVKGWLRLKK